MILAIVTGLAATMILIELLARARPWPSVATWWRRAALLNGFQLAVAWIAGRTWDRWLGEFRPWSIDHFSVEVQTVLGYVAITFVYYWWHRARHRVPLLWRWVHQVHHSPARIEVITSFYKHPLEILLNSWLSVAILYFLVGVGPEAAAWAVLVTGVAELFYHWNVGTPHHERGLHAFNYTDLPLWDVLFGTFRNPRAWMASCGFGEEREQRLGAMLRGREVA